ADPEEIAALTDLLGERPVGPLHEHVRRLLTIEERARRIIVHAAEHDPDAFTPLGVTPTEFRTGFCSTFVLAGAIKVGAPQRRRTFYRQLVNPGDDPAVIRELVAQGRSGVALCARDDQ